MSELRDNLLGRLRLNDQQIDSDIRAHRMADVRLEVRDAAGRPLPGVQVTLRQVRHAFGFGCNAFMLDEAPGAELNHRYEALFERLFNLTIVPLYWADLEPQDGKPRYAIDSPHLYRRPPVERVLQWCERTGITPKAHPLVWQRFWPEWITGDVRERLGRRIEDLCRRFGGRIGTWDVVNEALDIGHYPDVLPDDYVAWAFQQAAEHLPAGARLFYNDAVHNVFEDYRREYTPAFMLLQNLLLRGVRIDGIGLQFHYWGDAATLIKRAGELLDADHLRWCMDLYASLGRPLHISEISIPTWSDEQMQAELTRRLYRLWFSHPAVEAIIWWNLPDAGAETGAENGMGIGLVTPQYEPKAAYNVLDELINREWQTNSTLTTDADGRASCRLFPGEYAILIDGHPIEQHVRLTGGDVRLAAPARSN